MPRRLPIPWVDAFVQHTAGTSSPELFRKWAGIATVAGALERKVWNRSKRNNLYPNLYILLVGPAGVGKSIMVNRVRKFWAGLPVNIASSNLSSAAMLDQLREGERKVVIPTNIPPVITFHSLLIASSELEVLLPAYDGTFMGALTDLWDCEQFSERKRTNELNYVLPAVHLHMLAACTPSYLNSFLPEGAWEKGFMARTIPVYNGDILLDDLFPVETAEEDTFHKSMEHDLKEINKLYGRFTWEKDATDAIVAWYIQKGPPVPNHPKLLHYNIRRIAQLLKLCMVASASSNDNLVITLEHYQTALGWLLEVEAFMPDIFKAMGSHGDKRLMDDVWHMVYSLYVRNKQPVHQSRILEFISGRTPSHNVTRILDVMVRAEILKPVVEKIGTCYIPQPRR